MAIDSLASPARLVRWPAAAAILAALSVVALAVAGRHHPTLVALATWLPALGNAMLVNIGISALAIALGTLAGLVLGPLTLSRLGIARVAARAYVQVFRNAPLLVLIYFSTYVFPFEIRDRKSVV